MTREQRDPTAELPHVDMEMLADILSFTSVQFVAESIDEFLIAARDGLATIADAIAQEDRRVVERLAHRLRGSCGVTGATRLSKCFASLEEAAPEAPTTELSELLSRASAELECVNRELGNERRRLLQGSAGGG